MQKFLKVLKMLTDKRFLMAIFGLIAVAVPVTNQWFAINATALTNSIAVIATTIFGLLAYLSESPSQKDEKSKGGSK